MMRRPSSPRLRREAQIEALRKDIDALLGQRAGLLPLLVEIQTEKAKLAKAEEQLSQRDRVGTIRRTIDSDPTLMEAARASTNERTRLLGLQVRNEYLNGVCVTLDQQIVASRTKLSGLEKQRAELIDVRKLDASQLAQLNLLYTREAELDRLQTEFELAKRIYVEVSTRYEQARLQVAGRSAQLQIADDALAPDRPIGPRVVRNTALAIVFGFVLSIIGVLFGDAFFAAIVRERTRRRASPGRTMSGGALSRFDRSAGHIDREHERRPLFPARLHRWSPCQMRAASRGLEGVETDQELRVVNDECLLECLRAETGRAWPASLTDLPNEDWAQIIRLARHHRVLPLVASPADHRRMDPSRAR